MQSQPQQSLQPELELFLSSIMSQYTRVNYLIYFRKYQEFIGPDSDLFLGNNPSPNPVAIQNKIIEFITDMKSNGKGYSTIHNYARCNIPVENETFTGY